MFTKEEKDIAAALSSLVSWNFANHKPVKNNWFSLHQIWTEFQLFNVDRSLRSNYRYKISFGRFRRSLESLFEKGGCGRMLGSKYGRNVYYTYDKEADERIWA